MPIPHPAYPAPILASGDQGQAANGTPPSPPRDLMSMPSRRQNERRSRTGPTDISDLESQWTCTLCFLNPVSGHDRRTQRAHLPTSHRSVPRPCCVSPSPLCPPNLRRDFRWQWPPHDACAATGLVTHVTSIAHAHTIGHVHAPLPVLFAGERACWRASVCLQTRSYISRYVR